MPNSGESDNRCRTDAMLQKMGDEETAAFQELVEVARPRHNALAERDDELGPGCGSHSQAFPTCWRNCTRRADRARSGRCVLLEPHGE